MAAPLIVRLVMDAAGYLKTVDTAVGANTKLEQSSLGVGEAMQVSATKSVQASLRATEALKGQVAGYRELAAASTESAAVRERAALLANRAEGRLNSSLGLGTAGLAATSRGAQTAERDLGKTTRGLLAGSGAAAGLGRSLAFASTGFIAVASGATVIKSSIEASIALAKTQRQVDAQLKTTGKTWDQYGGQIGTADLKLSHVSGFTNQELLQSFGYLVRVTGNVSEALKLNAVAADVARGRNISLSSASIALGKALGGSETALKRLGITIPKTLDRMQALAYVQEKFAGQAAAGATVGDRFHASLVNTEEIIGNALLPTFTRLTTEIGDWLSKMNESGRLQRDVNEAVTVAGTVFHTLGSIIGFVDKVTGSFKTTLELVLGAFAISKVVAFGTALEGLAAKWGLVGTAAVDAGAAQTAAVGEGEVAAASRIILPAGVGAGTTAAGGAAGAAGVTAGALVAPVAIVATGAFLLSQDKSRSWNLKNGGRLFQDSSGAFFLSRGGRSVGISRQEAGKVLANEGPDVAGQPVITAGLRNFGRGGSVAPAFFPAIPGTTRTSGSQTTGPFGTATPIAVYSSYTQTITEQLAVAQAALTKTTKDDVSAARRIIARIKRLIDQGHLEGASLVQALQDEATQQGVLDNARQQAAQQAATIAAAKQAAASSYTIPIDLQIAEVRAQLTKSTADDIRVERQILAAAKAAVASGAKNKQGQLAALQIELQAQQALQSLQTQNSATFTQSLKLQLALAKAQALGTDQTAILLKMKAALERALKAAKGNVQKQIDIYNQIASINQQLGSSVTSVLGLFKQASTKALTQGLDLTPAQRQALRERLSQLGPGGTVPGQGTGAFGYAIDPKTGRPLHHHRRPRHRHPNQDGGGAGGGGQPIVVNSNIELDINLDGRHLEATVRKRQQRHRRRNPTQRRGPNAATA